MTLQDKTALVIGATGNIGRALTETLLQENASVVAVARHKSNLTELAQHFRSRVSTIQADCTREHDVQTFFQELNQKAARVNYVIYSAGIEPDADVPIAEYNLTAWRATFDTYVTGFFLVFRESLKALPEKSHIVAISSAVTRFTGDKLPKHIYAGHYAAAKSALDELCKWGRREAHQHGLLLSRISPAALDTPFHRNAPPHLRPPSLLPPQSVAQRITSILANNEEVDEVLLA